MPKLLPKVISLWVFVRNSLELDFRILTMSDWSPLMKVEFIVKKYLELFLLITRLKKFELGKSKLILFGRSFYYDSPLGLAILQSMYGRLGRMLRSIPPEGVNTIIDVGSNVGTFSLMATLKFPLAKIYAIEPIPITYQCLSRNIDNYQNIVPFNLALSEKKGFRDMVFNKEDSLVSKFAVGNKLTGGYRMARVRTDTLDNFCQQAKIKKIDLLKIDAETFEDEVLRGGTLTLPQTRYLLLEVTVEENSNYSFSKIMSLLVGKAYDFQLIYFRNYTGQGEGQLTVGDFLFENTVLKKPN